MSIPTAPSSVARKSSTSSLPNPVDIPLPTTPKQPTLSRANSQHAGKAEDAGLPKPVSRSNSRGSQKIGSMAPRRSTDDATVKLAASHEASAKKTSAKSDTPALTRSPAEITVADVEQARQAFHNGIDMDVVNAELERFIASGHRPEDALGVALQEMFSPGGNTTDHDAAAAALRDLIIEGHPPRDPSVHDDGSTPPTQPSRMDQARQMASAAMAFPGRVAANKDFTSAFGKGLASAGVVIARNLPSVFASTVARQGGTFLLEAAFQKGHVSPEVKAFLGFLFGQGLAAGLLTAGHLRDKRAGTGTASTAQSRLIMGGTSVAAGVAELIANAHDGTLGDSAALHIGFSLYTAWRDPGVQSWLRLNNPHTEGKSPDRKHFGAMSVFYMLDQAFVSFGMSRLASPSGPAAWHAGTSAADQVKNALIRGGLNLLGEVGEDLMFQGIPALRSAMNPGEDTHALELNIKNVGLQKGYLANTAFGPWAVRTAILALTISFLSAIGPSMAKKPAMVQDLLSALVVGVWNGVLYYDFANAGAAQPDPERRARIEDAESAGAGDRDSDTASVSTYAHPNVDMTNEAAVNRQQDMQLTQRRPGPQDASSSSAA